MSLFQPMCSEYDLTVYSNISRYKCTISRYKAKKGHTSCALISWIMIFITGFSLYMQILMSICLCPWWTLLFQSLVAPSPTVNTQEALKVVRGMFNASLDCEKQYGWPGEEPTGEVSGGEIDPVLSWGSGADKVQSTMLVIRLNWQFSVYNTWPGLMSLDI